MMRNVRLGRTELCVGEIGIGCWAIGGPFKNLGLASGWDGANDQRAKEGLMTAIDMGANLFDTADVYGFGRSERLVGWMLQKIQREDVVKREKMVVATKVGYFQGCAEHPYLPLHMRSQLEMSLHNLETSYIDIYWFHHLDFGEGDRYLEGAIDQMKRFWREGSIRFIGLRGPHKFSPSRNKNSSEAARSLSHFFRLADAIDPDVISLRYNALSRKYDTQETDLFKWAEERDLGIVLYKPLAQGLLLDKYHPKCPPEFSSGDHRSRKDWFESKGLTVLKERLTIVKQEFNCITTKDLVQLAIKYCLSRSENACVLVGFRTADQLRESLSTSGRLTKSQCEMLRKIFIGVADEIGDFINSRGDT